MNIDTKLIELIRYQLGLIPKNNHSLIWDNTRNCATPIVASPMSAYLHEVNRFLFDGGLNFDVVSAESEDPRQVFLNRCVDANDLQSSLESIWETGASAGEVMAILRLASSRQGSFYSLEWFDSTEYQPQWADSELISVEVKAIRVIGNEKYVYKLTLTPTEIIEYPLIEEKYERSYNWEANATLIPHNYGFVPAVIIKNKVSINATRGLPEFNFAACKTSAAAILATFDAFENVKLFGSPVLTSPDPDDTLMRIKKRIQVYTKEANEDGGGPEVLSFNAIQGEHLELIDRLNSNFNTIMGIRKSDSVASADVSSLTLRILNSATISRAESKWQNYVQDGLKTMMESILKMAAVDGILAMVNVNDPETYEVLIARKQPYFVQSPQEISQLLDVAERLVDLGVDRAQALKETIWTNLSIEQIEEKLRVNLEDV